MKELSGMVCSKCIENKKLFWKDVKKEMLVGKIEMYKIKRSSGMLLKWNEEINEVLKRHFESINNECVEERSDQYKTID